MINPWHVTLSVNAGLSLQTGGFKIWVDAVHDRKMPDFSTLTPEMQTLLFQSEAFRDPDIIAFTHCHPDHFSEALSREAAVRFPRARLILPEPRFSDQILLVGQEVIVPAGERLLTFRRLTHEGAEFAEVPHYGLMIEDGGESILVLGDCALLSEELAAWVRGRTVDAVFAPFPWITLQKPQDYILHGLCPQHLFIYHLPLATDDVCQYRLAAVKAAAAMDTGCDVRLLTEPFQTETF